MSVNHSK